ncbi:serine/threonine-protein kinase [Saccharopolyspora shandongensis]|uniref:serine/threonine-protein kinase n=1 Tax=Saccharopolyspora shandongensis TaxID=418495 RepID=UPI003448C55F
MSEERLLAERFALETVIGRGGMGTVWRAWDALLDRPVAVKEIHLPPGADHPELRARVLREARLAGKLNHPGAVTVFDAIEADDRIYIVMELVEAATLQDLVESEGPLPPARTVETTSRVLDVLQAAHRLGIVHRDVKPSNIMVAADGSVKLTDFGIARLDDGSTATASSIMVGSPAYMAPEHVRGRAVAASDLWALGVTLYFAVEGKSPYLRSTAGDSLAAVLSEEPPAPVRAGEALARLLGGLMAKRVDDRPTIEGIRAQLAAAAFFVPGFAISVFAIVATPRATGIRILAAWTAALAIRAAVDLAVLLDFTAYGFIDEHANPVVAVPSEFKASVALTCFAVLIGAALTVGRSIRERSRSWTTPR